MRKKLLLAGLALLVLSESSLGQSLLPNAQQTFTGPNGTPLAGGFVFTYVPGTTTPKQTWQNQALSVPNSNPVVLDSNGQARIWAGPGQSYRQVVLDSNSTLLWDQVTATQGSLSGTACSDAHVVTWASGGTSLGCDPAVSIVQNSLDVQSQAGPQLSSNNSLYFPTYSQLAGNKIELALSGAISDVTGSFRDGIYLQLTDSDITGTYTNSHNNYTARFAVFGPNSGGIWQNGMKNYQAISAYCQAANTDTPNPVFPTGCGAISGDSVQFGAGIGDNEFRAANPSPAAGGLAQSTSLVPVQAIVQADFADFDTNHQAWGLLITNSGAKKINAALGFSGNGTQADLIDANNVSVTTEAISMPHSGTTDAGSIINYGRWNGNPAGGSFSKWASAVDGGAYAWADSGNYVASFGVGGFRVLSTNNLVTQPALATTATFPFVHLTAMAGTPTGNPTLATTGSVPCVFDTSANKIWCFANAAWRGVAVAP